jgi:lipopolysaccharide transport system permease protein
MSGIEHDPAWARVRDTPPLESASIRRIVPTRRRLRLAQLPQDFPVIRVLAARDYKVKYKQSALGPLWLIFQPFALLAGFVIAFRGRASVGYGIPYAVFALSGLTVWSFFQASMTIGTSSLITNYQLVRFTPCPRLTFPIAGILASLPSLVVPALGALIASAATGILSPRAILLPLVFTWLFLFTVAVVAIASSLAVRFRDIINILPFLLSLGLFLAPIAYPLSGLSHWLRGIIDVNPLTGLLEACRWTMLSPYHPSLVAVGISLGMTAVLLLAGWRIFSSLETTMADEI